MNGMIKELNRVTLGLLIAFAIIAAAAGYWGVVRADSLRGRDDNARNVIAEQTIRRGTIYDRGDTPLAFSQEQPNGLMQRVYPYPETVAAVGYYSFRYGVTGLEAEYDAQLRGDTWRGGWDRFVDSALHRAERGGDVRATIDLVVQQAAQSALGDRSGAVVAVEVPSGRVLALASAPGYDPNTLDQQWDALTADVDSSPLLNRATAGVYQPGSALETVVLAALLGAAPDLGAQGSTVLNAVVPGAADTDPGGRSGADVPGGHAGGRPDAAGGLCLRLPGGLRGGVRRRADSGGAVGSLRRAGAVRSADTARLRDGGGTRSGRADGGLAAGRARGGAGGAGHAHRHAAANGRRHDDDRQPGQRRAAARGGRRAPARQGVAAGRSADRQSRRCCGRTSWRRCGRRCANRSR